MTLQTNDETKKKRLQPYTYLGCPLTRNRSAWCFRLCQPDEAGKGVCGRPAPHAMKSRLQLSIERYNQELHEAHCRKLERLYEATPCNKSVGGQATITPGSAEIVFSAQPALSDTAGQVDSGLCLKALSDAARLAVNSVVGDTLVTAASFTSSVDRPLSTTELTARGRFLAASAEHYLAEAVLVDADGLELARGHGTFQGSPVRLSPEIGYE